MKKIITPIFLIFVLFSVFNSQNFCVVFGFERNNEIVIAYNDLQFIYSESELMEDGKFSQKFSSNEILKKVYSMGFSPYQCISYVYPKFDGVVCDICKSINKEPIDSKVLVDSGVAKITKEQIGERVDTQKLYDDLFYELISDSARIEVEIQVVKIEPVVTETQNQNLTNLKSSFVTYINGNNQEGRIHNIKRAMSCFNGLEIKPQETLSFNNIVGETTEANGYALAKVILNGKYTEDYGGGVCQVATTIYNSALLAGLDVEKVRPHSLKVGYVLGSFDAMVSQYSDLVIKNPYDTSVYLHTYASDYECGVKIFGTENIYRIERRNEKIEFSEEEFPDVSYKSEGYLDYFLEDKLIKSEKIRKDTYYKVKIEE